MTHQPVSGKRARKLRIRARHAQLHARYTAQARDLGLNLTYDQWLHPRMRRRAALDELSAQAQALDMGYGS